MREYLFKGKSKETGEWIEGYIVYSELLKTYYILTDASAPPVEVIPESVGQYTGIKDKERKKIFEGDILIGISAGDWHKGVVTYDDISGRYYVDTALFDPNQYNTNTESLVGDWNIRGNIHDRKKEAAEI